MVLVALSFGSNLGKREKYIKDAISEINKEGVIYNSKISSILNTKALLKSGSPQSWDQDFLNCVMVGHTNYGLHSLLHFLQSVERIVSGRCKHSWAPREIDIDILLYGDMNISNKIITVPHKEFMNRPFLIQLLAEIAPNMIHPLCNKSFRELES